MMLGQQIHGECRISTETSRRHDQRRRVDDTPRSFTGLGAGTSAQQTFDS
jgi:hypothetical protein